MCDTVKTAEKKTREQAAKKGKKKTKIALYKADSKHKVKEEAQNDSDSDNSNYIIVNIK